MKKFWLIAVILVLACGAQGFGQIAYTDPANQGTQSYGGNLALDFTVNGPITVDALGIFDASGTGVITSPISVGIYDLTTSSVIATATFSGTYTPAGAGFDVFQSITPVTLGPGSYEVDAFGFNGANPNGNLNTGSSSGPILDNFGGAVTYTGAAWDYDTGSLDYPVTCSTCQAGPSPQNRQFDAGTFEVSHVPEGGAAALYLALAGLVCFGSVFASRRQLGSRA